MRSSPRPSLEGRPPVSVRSLATITLTCIASCASAGDALYVAGFDDVDALTEYESIGVTFGGTISLWFGGGCSVYQDPCCGPASVPNGICAGSCGGTTGIITFAEPQSIIFITALSGPGCDLLNDGTRIEAYDADGTLLGSDDADSSVQFDELFVRAPGIRSVHIISPVANNEAWDDLIFGAGGGCAPDLDFDGDVDPADLAILLNAWGSGPVGPPDLDHDGTVGPGDLAVLLGAWGPC